MTEIIQPIPARFKNVAVGGHVAGADQIIDDNTGETLDTLTKKDASTGTSGDHPYNGMGKIMLKKNMVNGVNTLTQAMLTQQNTIYVIQYDFTLGEDITVPSNCVLEFDGGSLSGVYTITGANTGINAGLVKIFNTNITLAGSWSVVEAYPEWFGAKGDGVTDDALAFNKLFSSLFRNLVFQKRTYAIGSTLNVLGSNDDFEDKYINGNRATFIPLANLTVMFDVTSTIHCSRPINFSNLSIIGDANEYIINTAIRIVDRNFNLTNVLIFGKNDDTTKILEGVYIQKSWHLSTVKNCHFHYLGKGIHLDGQVNVLTITKSAFLACDNGLIADGYSMPSGMVSHETDDLCIKENDFEGNKSSIKFADSRSPLHSWKIINNHFESNKGDEIDLNGSNIFSVQIIGNLFYGFSGIKVGTGNLDTWGVIFAGNNIQSLRSGADGTVLIGGSNNAKDCIAYSNATPNLDNIITVSDSLIGNTRTSGFVMVQHQTAPGLPWGTGDTKGTAGEIRYDDDYIYIKTSTGGWKRAALGTF